MSLVIPPAGLTPAGAWSPVDEAAQVARAWLVDPVDAATNELASMSGVGGTSAGDVVDDMVRFALRAVRASGASVQEDGQRFGDVRKLDGHAAVRLKSEAQQALRRLTDRALIRVTDLAVQTSDDWFEVTVSYVNLRRDSSRVSTQTARYAVGRNFPGRAA